MANFNAIDAGLVQVLSDRDRVDVIEVDPGGLMTFPQRAIDQTELRASKPAPPHCEAAFVGALVRR
jgi:hypothetical protein